MAYASVPARAHFLICYAPRGACAALGGGSGQSAFPDLLRSGGLTAVEKHSSGQSAFPDLLRSQRAAGSPPTRFRPERIS